MSEALQSTQAGQAPLYHPLDASRKELRLLQVTKSEEGQTVLKLVTVSLQDDPKFIALSHVWGEPQAGGSILLDGKDLPITQNIADIIQHLDPWLESCDVFFIDALCINQTDKGEVNSQVALMRDVYRKAWHVILWLGAGREYAARAVFALRCLAELGSEFPDSHEGEQALVGKAVDTLLPDDWSAIASLLAEQFWRRLWIVQEVLLSVARKAASLLIDDYVIDFATFQSGICVVSVFETLHRSGIPWNGQNGGSQVGLYNILAYVIWEQAAGPNLLASAVPMDSLCRIHEHLKTRDPKDRVYGFLGLLGGLDITVDYNKSVEEIYKDMTMAVCRTTNSLQLIVCKLSRGLRESALPSWAVDWGDFSDSAADVTYHFHLYDACGSKVPHMYFREDQMEVKGFPLFSLDKTNTLFGPDFIRGQEAPVNYMAGLQFAADLLSKRGSTVLTRLEYKENLLLALWLGTNHLHTKVIRGYKRIHHYTQFDEHDAALYRFMSDQFNRLLAEAQGHADNAAPCSLDELNTIQRRAGAGLKPTYMVTGLWCMLPMDAQWDDVVYVVAGASMPMVLRPVDQSYSAFKVVGPAYVHGMMDGEAVEARRESIGAEDAVFEKVVLV